MASSINRVDIFVKDYLLFRGFANALKGLEIDLKNDKEKGFRPDLISEQIVAHAQSFELTRLVEYWSHLDRRMFSRLEVQHQTSTRKLYSSLLKYYLVNCLQCGRQDKVQEFFEKMTPELQNMNDWKDWFVIPYMKQPENAPGFEVFFSKQWQEALLLSVHNYVSVTMQYMPLPALVCVAEVAGNAAMGHSSSTAAGGSGGGSDWSRRRLDGGSGGSGARNVVPLLKGSMELMDDFYNLIQTMAVSEEATVTTSKFPLSSRVLPRLRLQNAQQNAAALKTATRVVRKAAVSAPSGTAGGGGGGSSSSSSSIVGTGAGGSIGSSSAGTAGVVAAASNSAAAANAVGSSTGTAVNAAASVAASTTGALQQAAATLVQGLTSIAAMGTSSGIMTQFGQRQPATAVASPAVGSSSIGSVVSSEAIGESDRKPSFIENLGRRGTGETVRVEFSVDEAKVHLYNTPSVSSTDGAIKQHSAAVLIPADAGDVRQAVSNQRVSVDFADKLSKASVKRSSAAQDDCSDLSYTASPFHLLSQEEYSEHGSSAVTHCKFSKSGRTIVSADTNSVVKVWTLPSPVTVASVLAKSALVSLEWVDPADRMLLMGCAPDVIRLYDVKEKRTLIERSTSSELFINKLMALAVDPAGTKFACSSSQTIGGKDSGELMFWDLKTMEREHGMGDNVSITTMSYSRDGRLLIAGYADGSMRMIDVTSGSCAKRWNAHNGRVCSLYISNGGTSCYTVGYDSRLYQWSLVGRTCERVAAVSLHESAAGPFSWSQLEGSIVGSSSRAAAAAAAQPNPIVQQPRDKLFVLNSRETHLLACGSRGGCVYRLDKEGLLERTLVLGGHRAPVVAVDWSGVDTEICLTADMAGKVRLSTLLSNETVAPPRRSSSGGDRL